MKREFIIDGEKFNDLESFYCEIDRLFTKNLSGEPLETQSSALGFRSVNWKTGHNLDAFDDILYGGFGVHEFKEPIKIVWKNFSKSRNDFGYEATIKYYEQTWAICNDPARMTHITKEADLNDILNMAKKLLQDACDGKGETLADILVKIISNNREHDRTLDIIE